MQPAKAISLTKTQQDLVGNNNTFAFNLFQRLTNKEDVSMLFSPFSVASVLSMMLNGADGDTYSQIVESLGYAGYSLEDINGLYASMAKGLTEADKTVVFTNANSLWTNSFDVKSGFSEEIKKYYSAYLEKLDFSSPTAVEKINNWSSKQTKGKISNIVDRLEGNDQMVIANTEYFEGSWKAKFNPQLTKEDVFYCEDGSEVTMNMMNKTAEMSAAEVDGVKLCILPFGNGAYNIALVLPEKDADYKSFLNGFSLTEYQSLLAARKTFNVILSVPRISIDSGVTDNLRQSLSEMGINDAFLSSKASFPMIADEQLSISEIRQKVHFEMDEEGAKFAVATTAKGLNADDLPPQIMRFNANHPFAFLIYESSTGAILLMGNFVGK